MKSSLPLAAVTLALLAGPTWSQSSLLSSPFGQVSAEDKKAFGTWENLPKPFRQQILDQFPTLDAAGRVALLQSIPAFRQLSPEQIGVLVNQVSVDVPLPLTRKVITFEATLLPGTNYTDYPFVFSSSTGGVQITNGAVEPYRSFGWHYIVPPIMIMNSVVGRFNLVSLDIIEAAEGDTKVYCMEIYSAYSNTFRFTTDGISGSQTIMLPSSFQGITEFRLRHDPACGPTSTTPNTPSVKIDNIVTTYQPQP